MGSSGVSGVFEVPQAVDSLLEDISRIVGVVMAWENRKARRGPEDLSGLLVSHVFELYGALEVAGVSLGAKCPKQINKLLEDFRDSIEEIAHYLWNGEPETQKAVVLHADSLLFKMQIALFTLAIACVNAGPEDLADLNKDS